MLKKLIVSGAGLTLLVVATVWLGLPSNTAAQAPGILTLEGPGSSIGLTVREATADDAERAGLAQPVGVVVESVREGSPAGRAGFQVGDIVLDFAGERVISVRQFTRLVRESPLRRQVDAVVVRGTSRQTLQVVPEFTGRFAEVLPRQLEPRFRTIPRPPQPREFNFSVPPEAFRFRELLTGPTLGATVMPLSDQLAEYFGVPEGALVSSVESGSAAADAGLRAGDVITAIGGRSVRTAADVASAVRQARPGDALDLSVTRDRKALMLKATLPGRESSGRGGLPV